jgi:hypothetical protein
MANVGCVDCPVGGEVVAMKHSIIEERNMKQFSIAGYRPPILDFTALLAAKDLCS